MAQLMPLAYGVALPILVSLIVFAAARRLTQSFAAAMAVAAGFLTGQIALSGWPDLPPIDAAHWITLAVPTAIIVTGATRELAAPARWAARLILSAALLTLMLRSMITYSWSSTTVTLTWLFTLTALMLLTWKAVQTNLDRDPAGRLTRWHLIAVLSLEAVLLALSGSLLLAQLAGAGAAATGPLALFPRDRVQLNQTFAAVITVISVGLAVAGYFYAELPGLSALFLILALAAPGLLSRLGLMDNGKRPVLRTVLATLFPIIVAVIPIAVRLTETPAGYY